MQPARKTMRRPRASCALLLILAACAAPRPETASGDDVVARSVRSSVQLLVDREDDLRRAGSAVVLATDAPSGRALILTTAHLIVPLVEQKIVARTASSHERSAARVLAVDVEADLAVLETKGLMVAPTALRSRARLGDGIWVVSYPWGRRLMLVDGVVSQIHWRARNSEPGTLPITGPVRLIDAPAAHGTSGGGVYDRRTGRLVGIVRGYRTAKLSLPGAGAASLEVPIAGETTVIPTARIFCFLKTVDLGASIPAELRDQIAESEC